MTDAAQNPEDFDVLIIGAGINGAGVFRDLTLNGVKCLIVDKADIASGTSAAPSRLIHGGIKYLETGEFRLVAQSTLERNLLLANAPHYVKPLKTVIPIFSWFRGIPAAIRTFFGAKSAPRSRGAILIKLGLSLYDFYGARHRVMPRHSMMSRSAALASLTGLTPTIRAAGTYFDARVTQAERLVHELITDGLSDQPHSRSITYARPGSFAGPVIDIIDEAGAVILQVRPRVVVNAAGPWIDDVNAGLGINARMIGGTRGSHILLRHQALLTVLDDRMVYFEADDGRICLVYGFEGLVMVGSTDIPDDYPDRVACGDDEIDYMLGSVAALFPTLAFRRDDIVFAYSGIRPLPASNAAISGLISRDHSMPVTPSTTERPYPVISLIGGKWTTFRGFAEEVTDAILPMLGRGRIETTRHRPVGGGRDYPKGPAACDRWIAALHSETRLPVPRLATLFERYGTTAAAFARHEARDVDSRPLFDAPGYTTSEIEYIARFEAVTHLTDVILRRSTLAISGVLTGRDLSLVADVVGAVCGWSAERIAAERAATAADLVSRHRYRLDA